MKLTKIKKELEKLGYTFNSHKITKINSGRDENSMPILRDCEVLWVKTGAGDVAVICDLDGSNLHIFSHNGWAYLGNTHDSIIKAFGSMPASVEESNRRKRELWPAMPPDKELIEALKAANEQKDQVIKKLCAPLEVFEITDKMMEKKRWMDCNRLLIAEIVNAVCKIIEEV